MIAISPTDLNWFDYLKNELQFQELNFWTPTPWNIKKLSEGDKFYFMLKKPFRKIGGYGIFKYYENLNVEEAWSRFGKANGVNSLYELLIRCQNYQKKNSNKVINENPIIGCVVLKDVIFFEEKDFFKPEEYDFSFPNSVVKLKYFQSDFSFEKNIDDEKLLNFELIKETNSTYKVHKVKNRVSQKKFRENVLQAYENKCAITGEVCLEVLEAAHIQSYINEESNHIQNGILLRSDLHKLFDLGLLTIDLDYRILISPFLSSSDYLKLNGEFISLPKNSTSYPSLSALKRHNEYVFRKPINN